MARLRRAVSWVSFAFLAAAFLEFSIIAGKILFDFALNGGPVLIGPPDPSAWPFIPMLLPLTTGLVSCGLFAAKGSRRWGISSLLLSAGAGVGYALIPPQSFITTLYLHYRFFFGYDLLQAVQARRISWMLPLYCGAS